MVPFVIIMLAPNANMRIALPSGNTYLSSSIGLLVNVAALDISNLQNIGCILLTPRNNVNAIGNPTAANDFTQDYGVGSIWINVSGGAAVYVCTAMGTSPGEATWTAVFSGSSITNVTVVTSTSNIVVTAPTSYLSVRQGSPTTITITLPANPASGYVLAIKDALGVLGSGAGITFTVITSDSTLIDTHANYVMSQPFAEQGFVFDGTGWNLS